MERIPKFCICIVFGILHLKTGTIFGNLLFSICNKNENKNVHPLICVSNISWHNIS